MCLDDAKPRLATTSLALPPAAPSYDVVASVLNEMYDIQGTVARVSGEQDLNYRIVRASSGGDLMLKFINCSEPEDVTVFQTALLTWLGDREIPSAHPAVPSVIATTTGQPDGVVPTGSLAGMRTRLTSWLAGVSPRTFGAGKMPFVAVGRALAELHLALAEFPGHVPALEVGFDVRCARQTVPTATSHPNWASRAQAADVLERFIADDLPTVNSLPCQLIHHDFNQDNILLSPDGSGVVGTFDFGDAIWAPRVLDVAVAAAYLFDPATESSQMSSMRGFVTGYLQAHNLTDDELRLIPRLMRARYALALTLTRARAARASGHLEYATYLLRNEEISTTRMSALSDPRCEVIAMGLRSLSDSRKH